MYATEHYSSTWLIKLQLNLNHIITSSLFPSSFISSTMYMVICVPFIAEVAYINIYFGTEFIRRRISMRISMSHLKHIRVVARLTVFLVIMTILVTARGALVHATGLTTVSKNPSPYTGCSTAGQPVAGKVYVNPEVEPWVAVNPKPPSNIIVACHPHDWSNGGDRGR